MLARNAFAVLVATALTAVAASAQQPTTRQPASSTSTRMQGQQPTQGGQKKTARTSAASTMPVSADSAKRILMSNVPNATVSSERLRRSSGKAYYSIAYHEKGSNKTMHASVDAKTGAFSKTMPSTTKKQSGAAKKSG